MFHHVFIYSVCLIGTFFAAWVLFTRDLQKNIAGRWLGALLPALAWTLFCLLLFKVYAVLFDEHSWIRFQKTFVLAMGYPLYYGPTTGPALATIYGPVSVLMYLPATLTGSPFWAIRIAEALTITFYLFPAFWILLRGHTEKNKRILSLGLALCFVGFSILLTHLRNGLFTVHADAPTLGLCALAAGFIYLEKKRLRLSTCFLSALFAVLAVWSKQVAVPIVVALPFYILLSRGIKDCLRYTGTLIVTGLLVSGIFCLVFNFENMFFNMFTLPSQHPYKDSGTEIFAKSFFKLSREWLIMLIWGVYSIGPHLLDLGNPEARKGWFRRNGWVLFILIGLLMTPVAMLSNVKVGGSNNTLSYPNYFMLLGSLAAFLHPSVTASKLGEFFRAERVVLGLVAILLVVQVPATFARILSVGTYPRFAEQAYDFIRKNPGKSYFPRLTLLHLMGEKKLYHTIDGLMDRQWAGHPVTGAHLDSHFPMDAEWIGFSGEDHMWLLTEQKGYHPAKPPKELDTFRTYRRQPRTTS